MWEDSIHSYEVSVQVGGLVVNIDSGMGESWMGGGGGHQDGREREGERGRGEREREREKVRGGREREREEIKREGERETDRQRRKGYLFATVYS